MHEGKERVEDRQKSILSKHKRMVICLTLCMISTNYIQQETNWMLQLRNDPLVSCWLLPTAFQKTKGMKYTQNIYWLKSKVWSKTVEDVTDNHHMTKCMTVFSKKKKGDGKWGVDRGEGKREFKKWWSNAWDNQCGLEIGGGFAKRLMNQRQIFIQTQTWLFLRELVKSYTDKGLKWWAITTKLNIKLNQSDSKSTNP